jgi:DNA-binding response OmpR family regulator
MIKLLLIEDDPDLGRAIHDVLRTHRFDSTWVKTAEDAKRFVNTEQFDLLLLDIALPTLSGLDFLRTVRAEGVLTPIMMLTARDEITDRVIGLDAGADDYMGKPFAVDELLSRIRALLRRHLPQKSALWTIGDLVIDTARNQVKIKDEIIRLSKREFSLLCQLAARPSQVITRSQLTKNLDCDDQNDSNAIDVHVYSLRKKIGAKYISTVRGVGYLLEAPQ